MDMNHDGHHHGSGNDTNDSCPMIMSFHVGHCETILWKSWTARTIIEFLFSAIGIFVIAFIYEYLKYLRERYYHTVARAELIRITNAINAKRNQNINSTTSGCCVNLAEIESQKTIKEKLFNQAHLSQTFLHLIQVAISYLLMLIVMTFNYWLCLAVIFGAACGYFCFGWIRQQAIDFNEHCH